METCGVADQEEHAFRPDGSVQPQNQQQQMQMMAAYEQQQQQQQANMQQVSL